MRIIQTAACASLLIIMLMLMVAEVGAKTQLMSRKPQFTSFGRCQRQCVRFCRQAPAVQAYNPDVTDTGMQAPTLGQPGVASDDSLTPNCKFNIEWL